MCVCVCVLFLHWDRCNIDFFFKPVTSLMCCYTVLCLEVVCLLSFSHGTGVIIINKVIKLS